MYNRRRKDKEQEIETLLEAKDREIEELKRRLEDSRTELEAVNTSFIR